MSMVFTSSKSGQAAQPIALSGGYWLLTGVVVVSGSYPALGDPLDLTPFFPAGKSIRECFILTSFRGLDAQYDITNKKLRLWGVDPAAASMQVATTEHAAAAYDADMATAHPFVALLKG